MSSIVEYILKLKGEQFQSGIAQAERSTNALDRSFSSLKNTAIGLFGAFSAYQFFDSSVKAFNDSAQASAQLDASLRSTANAANLSRDALDAQASALMSKSLFDDDQITQAQALLATFTQIKDVVFMDAIPAIVDMSAKMGGDLQGSVIQVGKALNDPINGISALHRVGVDFNEAQKATIKTMVETNNIAGAQAIILKELQKEFGGSAQAASEAGTGAFTILQHEFQNVKEEVGALVVALAKDLMPELKSFVSWFKDSVIWLKEHKDLVKAVAEGIALYAASVTVVIPLLKSMALATAGATVATEGFTLATALAAAEVLVIVGAVSALVYAYNELANAEQNALEAQDRMASTHSKNTKKVLDEELALRVKRGENEEKARKDIAVKNRQAAEADLRFYQDALDDVEFKQKLLREKGFSSQADDLEKARMDMLENVKIYKAEVNAIDQFSSGSNKSPLALKTAAKTDPTKTSINTGRAVGSKAVTINVHINDLVKEMKVNITNFKQDAYKLKDAVEGLLTGAINDSQIIADR